MEIPQKLRDYIDSSRNPLPPLTDLERAAPAWFACSYPFSGIFGKRLRYQGRGWGAYSGKLWDFASAWRVAGVKVPRLAEAPEPTEARFLYRAARWGGLRRDTRWTNPFPGSGLRSSQPNLSFAVCRGRNGSVSACCRSLRKHDIRIYPISILDNRHWYLDSTLRISGERSSVCLSIRLHPRARSAEALQTHRSWWFSFPSDWMSQCVHGDG